MSRGDKEEGGAEGMSNWTGAAAKRRTEIAPAGRLDITPQVAAMGHSSPLRYSSWCVGGCPPSALGVVPGLW